MCSFIFFFHDGADYKEIEVEVWRLEAPSHVDRKVDTTCMGTEVWGLASPGQVGRGVGTPRVPAAQAGARAVTKDRPSGVWGAIAPGQADGCVGTPPFAHHHKFAVVQLQLVGRESSVGPLASQKFTWSLAMG